MKSMNLFDRKGESSEALFGDSKPKKKIYTEDFKREAVNLASKIGVTKAAKELGVSTSSIYSWQKTLSNSTLAKNHLSKSFPSAPIQDENGNLTFGIEGKTYSLNVYSEEERECVKKEVNANSLTKYDWFKERSGEKHWVLYNTKMYEAERIDFLHYRSDCDLVLEIPINATSCYLMFYGCTSLTRLDLNNFNTFNITDMRSMFFNCTALTQLDLSSFNTSNVIDMSAMFYDCSSLTQLNLSNFDTSKVTAMGYMFSCCSSLTQLDLSNFNTCNVIDMNWIFYYCRALTEIDLSSFDTSNVINMCQMFNYCSHLTQLDISSFNTSRVTKMDHMFSLCERLINIYISNKWNIDNVRDSSILFNYCHSLPNFNPEKIDIGMAKPTEQGGYLTLKK